MPAKIFRGSWNERQDSRPADAATSLELTSSFLYQDLEVGLLTVGWNGSSSQEVCIRPPLREKDTRASHSSMAHISTCEPQIHTVPRQDENELPNSKEQLLFPCASLQACVVKQFQAKVGRRWQPSNIEINIRTMTLGHFHTAQGMHRPHIQWLT